MSKIEYHFILEEKIEKLMKGVTQLRNARTKQKQRIAELEEFISKCADGNSLQVSHGVAERARQLLGQSRR